jgi:hypothetical protein
MTRDDDIIRMAQEANMNLCSGDIVYTGITNLTRFHAIAVAEEREACAKVCDARVGIWIIPAGPKECADAIRARSKT